MKILEDYKKIAQELLFEVDDEKIIKYKDKDGESAEMKAGSAKTMPDEHPAKQAYNKMKDDGGDDKEKPSGQKIGGSDFDRDAQNQKDADDWASKMFGAEKDKVTGGGSGFAPTKKADNPSDAVEANEDKLEALFNQLGGVRAKSSENEDAQSELFNTLKDIFGEEQAAATIEGEMDNPSSDADAFIDNLYQTAEPMDDGDAKSSEPEAGGDDFQSRDKSRMEKEYGIEIPDGKPDDSGYDDTAEEIADAIAKKYDISREYAIDATRNELADGIHDTYYSLADSLEANFDEMVDIGGHQRYDEPMYDTQGMEKMKYGESVKPKKKPFLKEQLERIGGGRY